MSRTVAGLLALTLCCTVLGQTTRPRVSAELIVSEPERTGEEIRELLRSDPVPTAAQLRIAWVKAFIDAKRPDLAADLCQRAILVVPGDSAAVESLLQLRTRSLLADGKAAEALGCARQLFGVSSMSSTGHALLLTAECLAAANAGDATMVERFRKEQTDGARRTPATTTKSASAPASSPGPIMLSIRVDGAAYEAAASKLFGEDYASLVSRGNLWMLAGKIEKAREVFRRAYAVAPDTLLPAATENLARLLKAEHGTIGPANELILSLRPPVATRPVRKTGG